jgi:hypothetical protein
MKKSGLGRGAALMAWTVLLSAALLAGCGSNTTQERQGTQETQAATEQVQAATETTQAAEEAQNVPADGAYTVDFVTDSTMFHVNEACEGKGMLTVSDGQMSVHISLVSRNIVNLYPGLAEDAQQEGAILLEPSVDTVTYSDGMTEEVYGFDVPVPALDEEFDLALIGKKGIWYDHRVSVSNPVEKETAALPEDGTYSVGFAFSGGSGKARILSPGTVVIEDGKATARIQWSSENYDYMIVDGEKYLPLSTEGGSVFEIPVSAFDEPLKVIGDTVAMSKPHEIEYVLTFDSASLR